MEGGARIVALGSVVTHRGRPAGARDGTRGRGYPPGGRHPGDAGAGRGGRGAVWELGNPRVVWERRRTVGDFPHAQNLPGCSIFGLPVCLPRYRVS